MKLAGDVREIRDTGRDVSEIPQLALGYGDGGIGVDVVLLTHCVISSKQTVRMSVSSERWGMSDA